MLSFEQFAAEGERGGSLKAALLKSDVVVVVVVCSSCLGGRDRRSTLSGQSYDGHQQVIHSVIEQRRHFEKLAAALRTQPLTVCTSVAH